MLRRIAPSAAASVFRPHCVRRCSPLLLLSASARHASTTAASLGGCPMSGTTSTKPTTTTAATSTGGCPFSSTATVSIKSEVPAGTAGAGCPFVGNMPEQRCPADATSASTTTTAEEAVMAMPTNKEIVQQLGKHRLSVFVTATTVAGYVLCHGTSPGVLAALTLGTYLMSISANTANQTIEVEYDRMMKRTHRRPLVIGAITRTQSSMLSAAEGSLGAAMLYAVCPMSAALGIANWAMYVAVYTPLKRLSTTNTWWGAIVGAIPPVMGGIAAAPGLTLLSPAVLPAHLLGLIMFAWQIPHFMSLAFHCRRDYEAAGFKMLPFHHPTRSSIYAIALSVVMAVATTVGLPAFGIPGEAWFYLASAVANGLMVYKSVMFHIDPIRYCRSCFVFSYMYLAAMLAMLCVNHVQPVTRAVTWYNERTARVSLQEESTK